MKKHPEISKAEFDALLSLLSDDQAVAADQYVRIRNGLVEFFKIRGCVDAECLADETINRVAIKLPRLDVSDKTRKDYIFYGFAKYVFKEFIRSETSQNLRLFFDPAAVGALGAAAEDSDQDLACLRQCLENLKSREKELIIRYYSKNKGEKVDYRQKIADDLQITITTLHVKAFRIRGKLKKCFQKCQKKM